MIVDDEPITARGYARALTAAGYNVTVAAAGREGATLARSKRFDAIVSDIAMPDMDGLALLRDIRQSDLDVPMIFMTGSPALETRAGGDRIRRVPLPAQAGAAGSAAGDRRRAPCAVHKLARVRREASLIQELEGKPIGDRAGPGGAVRVGGRQAVGRRAAHRVVVGAQHLRVRDAAAHGRADAAQPARLLRRRRAAGARRRAGAHHPRGTSRGCMARDAAGGARVRQPAPGRSRGRRAVRRRRRADAVREAGRPGDHRARGARSHPRAQRARDAAAHARLPHRHRRPGRRLRRARPASRSSSPRWSRSTCRWCAASTARR